MKYTGSQVRLMRFMWVHIAFGLVLSLRFGLRGRQMMLVRLSAEVQLYHASSSYFSCGRVQLQGIRCTWLVTSLSFETPNLSTPNHLILPALRPTAQSDFWVVVLSNLPSRYLKVTRVRLSPSSLYFFYFPSSSAKKKPIPSVTFRIASLTGSFQFSEVLLLRECCCTSVVRWYFRL
jgi:hypothetical protein